MQVSGNTGEVSMSWDEYFFGMINQIKAKSKDPSTKVGCIIVAPDHSPVSMGFNGFPRGVRDKVSEVPERYERPKKYLFTVHGERNAIYAAAKKGAALNGCRLYIEWYPCADCMQGIIQSGIVEVVVNSASTSFNDSALYERWKDHIEAGQEMAQEAGVVLRCVNVPASHI